MLKKFLSLVLWIIIFQVVGYLIGQMTQSNIVTWYQTLNKSAFNPPQLVFPIVWGILYLMLAVAGWSLWEQRKKARAKLALLFYGIQLLMNWTWTPLFFQFHLIQLSFYWIIGIIVLTLVTIFFTWNKFKLATVMLVPYWFWLLFASYLNAVIWIKN